MNLPMATHSNAVESFYEIAEKFLRETVPDVPYGEVGLIVTIHDHQIVRVKKIRDESCKIAPAESRPRYRVAKGRA